MYRRTQRMTLGCALLGAALIAVSAYGGIPKPGLILYGKVTDGNGNLLTQGELVWTFTPSGGGAPVTLTTALRELTGMGEVYSYRAVVPLETPVDGFPASAAAIPVATASVEYVQQCSVVSTSIQLTQTVTFSTADIGSAKRVDVCADCDVVLTPYHSADMDRNYRFSLSELLRVVEFNTATLTHEYHVDASGLDGYSTGAGNRIGAPHSGDFYGGADWRISVHEVIRMIDLFASTPEHAYNPDSASEDGFRKGAGAAVKSAQNAAKAGGAEVGLEFHRMVRGGAVGAGPMLEITIVVTGINSEPLSAIGLSEFLPEGWTFDAAMKESLAAPMPGATGNLEFAWYPVPAIPFDFSYRVRSSGPVTMAAVLETLTGEGVYRTTTGEDQTLVPVLPNRKLFGLGDMDGDGIQDVDESAGDTDGDGVPNPVDVDSDNDGVSDREEANFDNNPDYNPFDPVNNPNGTDTNTESADSDNDGVPDADDVTIGPDRPEKAEPVPAMGRLGVFMAAALIALAGLMRLRRVFGAVR